MMKCMCNIKFILIIFLLFSAQIVPAKPRILIAGFTQGDTGKVKIVSGIKANLMLSLKKYLDTIVIFAEKNDETRQINDKINADADDAITRNNILAINKIIPSSFILHGDYKIIPEPNQSYERIQIRISAFLHDSQKVFSLIRLN